MDSVLTVLYSIVTVFVWLGAAVRMRDLVRDPRNRPLRALLHMAVSLGLVLLLVVGGDVVDTWHGFDGLTSTLWHILALWAATQFGVFLLHSSYTSTLARPRTRRRLLAFTAAAAMIALAWLAANQRTQQHGFRVIDTSVASAVWQAAFLGGLSWALLDGARLAFRYSRQAEPRDLRVGLRLLGSGSLCGLAFCAAKVGTASAQLTDIGPTVPGIVLVSLVAAAVTLTWSGVLYPAVTARLRALPQWCQRRRQHRLLFPLWSELHREFPMQSLSRLPPRSISDLLQPHALRWRHYRRVIELDDMLLLLRPWCSATIRDRARRIAHTNALPEHRTDAFVHGTVLAAALHAKRTGQPKHNKSIALEPPKTDNLDEEARWLLQVQNSRYTARVGLGRRIGAGS